jgi:hypothetical protein
MKPLFACASLALILVGCVGIPPDAFKLPPSSLADRQMQSRTFATTEDALLLSASVAVLQDLGYALDATNSHLGVLTASKDLSAKSATQIVGMIVLAALTGAAGPIDDKQKIRVCLVVTRAPDKSDASVARITIQRIVWDTQGQITLVAAVTDQSLYEAFFAKLEKATFLEANRT